MARVRVAIVADWIIAGGAERVVQELHNLYPDAPIYTSYCTNDWRKKLDNKVITGYLQHWPFSKLRKFAGLISPLRTAWYRHIDFKDFDIVISATGNGEAKFIRPPRDVTHICYCFTPVHYYWRHYETYLANPGFGPLNSLARIGLKLLVKPLRKRDLAAAKRIDHYVAISSHIQNDIKTYYGKESTIIAPPVNVERFLNAKSSKNGGFITMGRQQAYKRTELIVDACTQAELRLTVVGNGPEHDNLVRRAGPTVTFLSDITDEQMAQTLANASAFIFAGIEDFGVAPVEGMAAGLPLIAYRGGGALDYVEEGKTGEFFDEPTAQSLLQTLQTFTPQRYKKVDIQNLAKRFSAEMFKKKISAYVQKVGKS